MRNVNSYAIATLIAATMLATPVLANEVGHHTKQSDPAYWSQDRAPQNAVSKDESQMQPITKQVSDENGTKLVPGGGSHGRGRAPVFNYAGPTR